jgi:hypothetical protein
MKNILILTILLISNVLVGQTGPAGVGTNDGTSSLKLWYRTDFGLTTSGTEVDAWQNGAGVAAHNLTSTGGNRPSVVTASVNGYDELNLDGNDFMQVSDALSTTNFITDQATSFVVHQRLATTNSWVYATSPHQTDRFSCHITWGNGNAYYDIGGCCGTQTRIQVNGLGGLGNYYYWSFDASNTLGKQLYRNGSLLENRNNTQTYTSHGSQTFRIGESTNGNITEIIIYNQRINSAQRLIIENYLAAKYNIAPATNDIFDEDDIANGNYDHDVAGIGRVGASNIQNDSRGTGIVRILNPTNLGDDEFLIWGHDNGVQLFNETTDIPVSLTNRLVGVWRASEVSAAAVPVNVGNIDMRFDLTGIYTGAASDLYFLVDTDNDGIFSDETPLGGANNLGGNIFEFAGVTTIANNLRFTLGSNISPLPIELLSFDAVTIDNRYVELVWQTSSETNNNYFTIERSKDGNTWEAIDQIDGAGTSNVLNNYVNVDKNPHQGVSYYRLKQTDYDELYTYSQIRSADISNKESSIKVYPNPTSSSFVLTGDDSELESIKITNMLGQDVTGSTIISKVEEAKYMIDLSQLNKGIYSLYTKNTVIQIYKK